MQPLFAVHNNVSLLSVTIAPSTFLAALTLALVFLSLYLPRLPSLPRLFNFRRRRTNANKDIVLQRRQRIVRGPGVLEIDDDEDFVDARQRRNRELFLADLRTRELPALPPSRLLLPGQAGTEGDARADLDIYRKKRSSRSERAKAKEKESDKEKLQLRARQQKSGGGGTSSAGKLIRTPSPRKKHTKPTTTSAELVVRSRQGNLDIYGPVSHSYDSSDREDGGKKRRDYYATSNSGSSDTDVDPHPEGEGEGDAASWVSFGAFGPISPHREHQPHPPQPQQDYQFPPPTSSVFSHLSTHSAFLETDVEENESLRDSASVGGYSPPAWRRLGNGDRSSGFWRKSDNILGSPTQTVIDQHQHSSSPPAVPHFSATTSPLDQHLQRQKRSATGALFSSRESSSGFDSDDEDVTDDDLGLDDVDDSGGGVNYNIGEDVSDDVLERAMRTRLPGSLSPEKERSPEPQFRFPSVASRLGDYRQESGEPEGEASSRIEIQEPSENYIRFAVRAEVQHRTELIESTIGFVRGKVHFVTRSWAHIFGSMLVGILSLAAMRSLSQPAGMRPVPDLVKVAGIARAFEPLIYYSENGVAQVGDLQATGVAVWDLGESVRLSNLTSAPIIVKELDDLSETLKTLAIELTKFFANVDGDIDGILIVMDWARRELSQLQHLPSSSSSSSLLLQNPLTAAYDNVHNLLSSAGLLENSATGTPTVVGALATKLFGMSGPQRTRATLRRTFYEFLAVLEEAVSSELQHSLALFALFEAVDHQFLNLARTVVREASVQDERHADLLASLWTRILGPSAAELKKYEQNRELLRNVREKTVRNKGILVEHNHRLLALKASLESLRRKLVSPLVRSVNSSTLTLDEQVRGLEDVGVYLERVRTRQKGKLMEIMYGPGAVRGGNSRWASQVAGRSSSDEPSSDEGIHYDESRMIDDSHP